MPSMLTHRLLGDDVLKTLGSGSRVLQASEQAFQLYSIGTSGPDLFFFYAAWPWADPRKAYRVARYGSWMHEGKTDLLFRTLITMCRESGSAAQLAYTTGVLLHWCLDHEAHPYVFNRTGVGHPADIPHRFFESLLDKGMIDWKRINLTAFPPYKIADYGPQDYLAIWELYSEALKKGWDTDLGQQEIRQAVKDFRGVERALYDPKGTKLPKVRRVEELAHQVGAATSMIIPRYLDPAWDVMNEDHRVWHHPSTNEEHRESFKEIYQKALADGTSVLEALDGYLAGQADLEAVMGQITGNFHTGLKVPDDLKFFDLVPYNIPKYHS